MKKEKTKEYIYIAQASQDTSWCKIGKTNDYERRLKEYNTKNTTGVAKKTFSHLFVCEVKDMTQVENDIKEKYSFLREVKNKEIYLYNEEVFKFYTDFIKAHPLFIKEIPIEEKIEKVIEKVTQYVKKETPTLKERKMTKKDIMQRAKRVADDEFYTKYEDIEKEIAMYDKEIWKDKCVFCNCDDAVDKDERRTSSFALYFLRNFKELKLKKLICTHYGSKVDLFNAGARGYIFTLNGVKELKCDYDDLKLFPEKYDGSFDHPISVKILNEEADIVCTNPPFSRSREYWKLVVESGKKFLIVGNISSFLTSAYTPYLYNNKVWAGHNEVNWCENPKRQTVKIPGQWYTNFPIKNRIKYKLLKFVTLKEIPDKYKKIDDKGILLVDRCWIPINYKKPFAVSAYPILSGLLEKGYKVVQEKRYNVYIDGKEKYARVLVQKVE